MSISTHAALKVTNKHEVERIIKESIDTVFDLNNKQWFLKDTHDGIHVFTDIDKVCIG